MQRFLQPDEEDLPNDFAVSSYHPTLCPQCTCYQQGKDTCAFLVCKVLARLLAVAEQALLHACRCPSGTIWRSCGSAWWWERWRLRSLS